MLAVEEQATERLPAVSPQVMLQEAPRVAAILQWSPLKIVVDEARLVMLWGRLPDFVALSVMTAIGAIAAMLGFAWFQKTRRGFADVL